MENNERGLYKLDPACGLIYAPNAVGIIQTKDHIHKPEATEIIDGWFVFYTEQSATDYFNNSDIIMKNNFVFTKKISIFAQIKSWIKKAINHVRTTIKLC
jgi:hypothetical protein